MIFITAHPILEVKVLGLGWRAQRVLVHQAILDVWCKPLVVHCGQGPLVKPCKDSILVKVNVVPSDVMAVPHSEVAKLVGSGGHWVGPAKGGLEGLLKDFPVRSEVGQVIILEFKVGFIPM